MNFTIYRGYRIRVTGDILRPRVVELREMILHRWLPIDWADSLAEAKSLIDKRFAKQSYPGWDANGSPVD